MNCMPDKSNSLSGQLRADYRGYYSIGIHPRYITDVEFQLQELRQACVHPRVVAIGEAGLDKLTRISMTEQQELFKKQALLAEEFTKPLIIHCVKAWEELIAVKKKLNPAMPWVVHGFRGNEQLAGQLIKQGFCLSFGGKFNPQALQPDYISRILAETDNSNLSIRTVYQQLAETLKMDPLLFSNTLRENVRHIFTI